MLKITIKKHLQRYGDKIFYDIDGKQYSTHGIITPISPQNKTDILIKPTDLGISNEGRSQLIATPMQNEMLTKGLIITTGNTKYYVHNSDHVHIGDDIFYMWAIVSECEENYEF